VPQSSLHPEADRQQGVAARQAPELDTATMEFPQMPVAAEAIVKRGGVGCPRHQASATLRHLDTRAGDTQTLRGAG
jgi:hypothetical protein